MSETPDASAAHPAYERELSFYDLSALPVGHVVIDKFLTSWTKDERLRWVSIIEPVPGMDTNTLLTICGPLKNSRRQPNQEA